MIITMVGPSGVSIATIIHTLNTSGEIIVLGQDTGTAGRSVYNYDSIFNYSVPCWPEPLPDCGVASKMKRPAIAKPINMWDHKYNVIHKIKHIKMKRPYNGCCHV